MRSFTTRHARIWHSAIAIITLVLGAVATFAIITLGGSSTPNVSEAENTVSDANAKRVATKNANISQPAENDSETTPVSNGVKDNASTESSQAELGPYYAVSRVVDGDTIIVQADGIKQRVRLIGVNTPESVHPTKADECYGAEASNYLKNRLADQSVQLEADDSQGDVDKYSRLLRYVYLGGENLNFDIIYSGYGHEYTYNTPYRYQAQFQQAEQAAKLAKRGLWGACQMYK